MITEGTRLAVAGDPMLDVLIDPGHGGHRPLGRSTPYGGRTADGRLEKDLNLQVARALQGELRGRSQLTRSDDRNLRLGARTEHARQLDARSFVSVHSDLDSHASRVWVHEHAGPSSHALADEVCGQLHAYGAVAEVVQGPLAVLDPALLGRERAGCMVELGTHALGNPRAAATAIARGVDGWLVRQPRPRWGGPARISETDRDPAIHLFYRGVGTVTDPHTHHVVIGEAGDLSIGVELAIEAREVSELRIEVLVESGPPRSTTVVLRDYLTVTSENPLLWGRSVPVPVGPLKISFTTERLIGTAASGDLVARGNLTL